MYAYETADDIGATKTQASGGLMPVVIAGGVLTLIGTALGLGLGVGLHTDDKSLIYVTTTVATTVGTQSVYSGSLSSASGLFGGINQATANYSYEAIQVIAATSGTYVFTSATGSNLKLNGYLYNNTFYPTNPLTNLIARGDGNSGSLNFNLSSALEAGKEYILVVTSDNQTNTGSFNVTATGPGTVAFTRRAASTQLVTYGTLVNNAANDITNGSVTINTNDVISNIDGSSAAGYVSQVSMSFFTAPTPSTGQIYIYVFNGSASTLSFTSNGVYQIPASSLTNTTGVQTFTLPRNQLPVVNGQYVGVGIGTGGGSLHQVANRSQAYLLTSNFTTLPSTAFTSKNTAIAFLYQILTASAIVG